MKIAPTERANYLVSKFGQELAPKVVDEIINALETYDDDNYTFELQNMDGDFRYWDKVKNELNKQEQKKTRVLFIIQFLGFLIFSLCILLWFSYALNGFKW
jgi:hypothetical protein